jgi:FAD/FMN-containing dehydrogenase
MNNKGGEGEAVGDRQRKAATAFARLRPRFGSRISIAEDRRMAYSRDWSMRAARDASPPDLVVLPETQEEVKAIIDVARELKLPVVPFAGGTGAAGGAVPIYGGIAVDLKRLNRIIEIDSANYTVTCGAGTVVLSLTRELEKHGFWLPQQTESKIAATVGGGINCNSRATFGIRYGDWIDTLLSGTLVTGRGDIIRVGHRKTTRSATGYNLLAALVGSEGTLGILTEVTLRIHRIPEIRQIKAFLFRSVQEAVYGLQHLLNAGLAVEGGNINCRKRLEAYTYGYEQKYGKPLEVPDWARAILFVTYAGNPDVAAYTFDASVKALEAEFGAQVFDNQEMLDSWWAIKHSLDFIPYRQKWPDSQRERKHCVADIGIPLGKVGVAYDEFLKITEKNGLEVLGMNVYNQACNRAGPSISFSVAVDDTDEAQVRGFRRYLRDMGEMAIRLEGTLSCALGDGDRLVGWNIIEHGEALGYMRELKRVFDPDWIMNPGKKITAEVVHEASK